MVRALFLLVIAAGGFSFLAFKRGGYLPGVILALVAIAVIVYFVLSVRRPRAENGQRVPWSGNAKKIMGAVGAILLLGTVYSMYWTFWVPKASKDALTATYQLEDLCNSMPTYFPDAAHYGDGGPHPIVGFAKTDDIGLYEVRFDSDAPQYWHPQDAKSVQLVACMDSVESGPKLTTCTFTKGSLPLYQGRYTGALREAATGKKVADISVDGTSSTDCPGAALTEGDNPRLHSAPDLASMKAALGKYVEG